MADSRVTGVMEPPPLAQGGLAMTDKASHSDPWAGTFPGMRQRAKAEVLAAYFDPMADNWELYRDAMHISIVLNARVPDLRVAGNGGPRVGCATGDLLAAVGPGRGVGVDLSPCMVEKASRKYPAMQFVEADAAFFDTAERFDYILINNVLEYVDDIQGLLRNCRRLLKPRGRLLLTTLNPLWTPLLRIGDRRRLCTPDTQRNFVTGQDAANLLGSNGFEVVKLTRRTLFPKNIPVFTSLVNLLAAQTPVIRRLCLTEFLVARPAAAVTSGGDYSVSVVVPCYNEAGNIEDCVRRIPAMGAIPK